MSTAIPLDDEETANIENAFESEFRRVPPATPRRQSTTESTRRAGTTSRAYQIQREELVVSTDSSPGTVWSLVAEHELS